MILAGASSKRGSVTTNGAVPTAHVMPNFVGTSTDSALGQTTWAEPTSSLYRRTPSLTSLRQNNGPAAANQEASTFSHASRSVGYETSDSHTTNVSESLFRPSVSSITSQHAHLSDAEFQALMRDPEQTMDQSRFVVTDSDLLLRSSGGAESRDTLLADRETSEITARHGQHSDKPALHAVPRPGSGHQHLQQRSDVSTLHTASNGHYLQSTFPPAREPLPPYRSGPSPAPSYVYERPPSQGSFQAASYQSGGSFYGASGYGSVHGGSTLAPYTSGGYDDVAHWHLQHQEQLRRQQLDTAHVSNLLARRFFLSFHIINASRCV